MTICDSESKIQKRAKDLILDMALPSYRRWWKKNYNVSPPLQETILTSDKDYYTTLEAAGTVMLPTRRIVNTTRTVKKWPSALELTAELKAVCRDKLLR